MVSVGDFEGWIVGRCHGNLSGKLCSHENEVFETSTVVAIAPGSACRYDRQRIGWRSGMLFVLREQGGDLDYHGSHQGPCRKPVCPTSMIDFRQRLGTKRKLAPDS